MASKEKTETPAVEELLKELEGLRSRVASLEAKQAAADSAVTPEIVAILAAAATAFLGKKVRIRAAREVKSGETSWLRQGRQALTASHNLSR